MRSQVGSELPYARIEHFGGVITAKNPSGRLFIRGTRGGTRSDTGGDVTATATSVQHRGKFYLNVVTTAFPALFMAALRRMMPK